MKLPFGNVLSSIENQAKIQIEDHWEQWEQLSKRQLIRRSHPCKISITFFARNIDREEHQQVSQIEENSPHHRNDPSISSMDAASVPNPEKRQSDTDDSLEDEQSQEKQPRSHNPESIPDENG